MSEDIFFHRYTPTEGDFVVELGAYSGYETCLISAKVGPDGKVIAVEPSPGTFATLTETVKNLTNVELIEAAVVDTSGTVNLSAGGGSNTNSVVDGPGVSVKAVTLDEVAAHLDRVDLLKINIEGSETKALRGGPETLGKTRNIVVSCHDFMGFDTKDDVREILAEAGFTLSVHDDPWKYGPGSASGGCVADYLYGAR